MVHDHDTFNILSTKCYELAHGIYCPFFLAYLECVAYLNNNLAST